ncbi:MAG: O-antigen ligase family protein [Methylococcales bacterium]
MTFLIFGCWLLSSQASRLHWTMRYNAVAACALGLYAILLVGTLYSSAGLLDSLSMLRKYREFPLLVILLPFMREEKYRRWIIFAWVAACVLTLAGSYLQYFGILPMNEHGSATFKSRITHNLFMAFFAFYCIRQLSDSPNRRRIWLWFGAFLLTVLNLFILVDGRTGQVVLVLLMVLFCFQRLPFRQATILAPLLIVCFGVLVLFGNTGRFNEGIEQSRNYLAGRQNLDTSMGQRLYFWENSIRLIRERPVFGYGTGSFTQEFDQITTGKGLSTHNPHNEYLMFSVQWGAIGFAAYLYFLSCLWRCSLDLPKDRRWFAQGLCLSLVVNSLLNSTFLDHTEGHWYATLIALCYAGLGPHQGYDTKVESFVEDSR